MCCDEPPQESSQEQGRIVRVVGDWNAIMSFINGNQTSSIFTRFVTVKPNFQHDLLNKELIHIHFCKLLKASSILCKYKFYVY